VTIFVDTFEVDYGNEYDDIGFPLLDRPLQILLWENLFLMITF